MPGEKDTVFTQEQVNELINKAVTEAVSKLPKSLTEEEISEKIKIAVDENTATYEKKIETIKEGYKTYISEADRLKLEAEEKRVEAKKVIAKKKEEEDALLKKIEERENALNLKEQSITRIEVADELNIPKHLRKYIMGSTKEEMISSAQVVLADMGKTEEEFNAMVQTKVEEKFANGGATFTQSSHKDITLDKFITMTTAEKIKLMEDDYETFTRLREEKLKREN
ncbi:MAG: hypothetical protein ACRCX2_01945 [Paraclostridium sp.]